MGFRFTMDIGAGGEILVAENYDDNGETDTRREDDVVFLLISVSGPGTGTGSALSIEQALDVSEALRKAAVAVLIREAVRDIDDGKF